MRTLKSVLYVAFIGVALTGCKSISKIPVPAGANTPINAVAKKMPLTDKQSKMWSHLDLKKDSIPGMSLAKAYAFLKGKKWKTVIVGVVDSGDDLKHEDLKDVAWTNPKEIQGNGKDDDKNGYVDDIHGWNFLGKIYKEHLEYERIVRNPEIASKASFKLAKAKYDKKVEGAKQNESRYSQILESVVAADTAISKFLGKTTYTKQNVLAIKTEDPKLIQQISVAKRMYGFGVPSLTEAKKELIKLVGDAKALLSKNGLKKDYRKVLGDDPNTMDTKYYGDNNIQPTTKDEAHATHVSGIIAATRNNGIGINGIANHVKIMSVRAVPDGDEYDKDVALAIRYATDNGAKIINASFGKGYSPHKQWVFDAIKYAASKDVLIVNAAGNDGKNIDVEKTYPNDAPDLIQEISDNMLTVGAMGPNYNKKLVASFSNYGKRNVDVFAPGVKIYSTTPQNEYKKFSGTSMAAPSCVGIAALIRSYYPKLTASQVKHILMNSGIKVNFDVIKPGSVTEKTPTGQLVPFSSLSVSGRIVNAYNALKMADKMVNGN